MTEHRTLYKPEVQNIALNGACGHLEGNTYVYFLSATYADFSFPSASFNEWRYVEEYGDVLAVGFYSLAAEALALTPQEDVFAEVH